MCMLILRHIPRNVAMEHVTHTLLAPERLTHTCHAWSQAEPNSSPRHIAYSAVVLADARPPALLAPASWVVVLADARPAASSGMAT